MDPFCSSMVIQPSYTEMAGKIRGGRNQPEQELEQIECNIFQHIWNSLASINALVDLGKASCSSMNTIV